MALRVFRDGSLLLETPVEESLTASQDFAGLLKQRICDVKGVPSHRQRLLLGKSEVTEGCSWKSLGGPLQISVEIAPEDHTADLLTACEVGHEMRVRCILRQGQNPNVIGKGQRCPLDVAVEKGHAGTVRALLEGKANLTANALHVAAEKEKIEVLQCLISARAQLNLIQNGQTALQMASERGLTEVVKILLSSKAELDVKSHNTGETALHLASSYDTAMALLEAKACPDITDDLGAKAFFRAGENGREDVAKAFLDAGVLAHWESIKKVMRAIHAMPPLTTDDRKLRLRVWGQENDFDGLIADGTNVNAANHFGYTPIHLAALVGNAAGIRTLSKWKADVNLRTTDEEEITPVQIAALSPWPDVFLGLMHASADINQKGGRFGQSALHVAASIGHLAVVRQLIFARAILDDQDADGATPLHLAAAQGSVETSQFLLVAGASADHRDSTGLMPVHIAASTGNVGVLKSLLMAFARLEHPAGSQHNSTLHLAVRGGHLDCVRYLVEAMVPLCVHNSRGDSPLHVATTHAHLDVLRYLLQVCAPVNAQNLHGETPLNLALHDGFREVAQILRAAGGCANDPSWAWPKNCPVYPWAMVPVAPIPIPVMPMPTMPMNLD